MKAKLEKIMFAIQHDINGSGKSLFKNGFFTLLRAAERVIERLSDDRVSANEATLAPMHHDDYSPRLLR